MARTIRLNFDVDSRGIASTDRGLRGLDGRLGMLSRQGMNLKRAFSGFSFANVLGVVGIGSVTAAISTIIKKTSDWGDTLAKTADSGNITIEMLQRMRYLGERAGISIETTDKAVLAFNKRLGRAADEAGLAAKSYEILGISAKDLADSSGTGSDALLTVIERLAEIEEPARQAALATQVLGDTYGKRILPLLKNGSEGIREVVREGERLGFVFSEEEIRRTEGFADAWLNLTTVAGNLSKKIGLELLPDITNFLNKLLENDDLVPNLYKAMEDAASGAKSFASGAAAAVRGMEPLIRDIRTLIDLAKTAQEGLTGTFEQWQMMRDNGVWSHVTEGAKNDLNVFKRWLGFGGDENAIDGTTGEGDQAQVPNRRARPQVPMAQPVTVTASPLSRIGVAPSGDDGGTGDEPEPPIRRTGTSRGLEDYKRIQEEKKRYYEDFVMHTRRLSVSAMDDEQLRIEADLELRLDALEQEKQAVKERYGLSAELSQAFADRVNAIHVEAAEAQRQLAENMAGTTESSMGVLEKIGARAVSGLGDAFESFFSGQRTNLADFTKSFLSDIGKMLAKMALLKAASSAGGYSGFLTAALGGGTTGFAKGGVLTNPSYFPLGNGRGVAGEAGPEAIMPLKRGRDGKLGVSGVSGGTSAVINNNITFHASGNEQTDRNSINQLRMAVDQAVKKQLAEQQYSQSRGY